VRLRWLALYAALAGIIAGATYSRAQMWQPWTHGTPAAAGGTCASATKWSTTDKDSTVTISADQCTATGNVLVAFGLVRSTTSHASGEANKQWYFEITFSTAGLDGNGKATNNQSVAGVGNASVPLTSYPGSGTNGVGLQPSWDVSPWASWYYNAGNTGVTVQSACLNGTPSLMPFTMGFRVDLGSGTPTDHSINCTLDGVNWNPTAMYFVSIQPGPYFITWSGGAYPNPPGTNKASAKINTGPTFTISGMPPSGFSAWQ
jgi:hypothetical protein